MSCVWIGAGNHCSGAWGVGESSASQFGNYPVHVGMSRDVLTPYLMKAISEHAPS